MYEIDWDYYQTQLRLLSGSATKNLADLTRADVTKLICAVEGNIGCRKKEILDPTVIFQSYAKWAKELDASGLPVSTDFVLGDEREGLVLDRDRALEEFRQENIIVQRGRFKDANQRDMKYNEDGVDEILRTNAIIKRPCLTIPLHPWFGVPWYIVLPYQGLVRSFPQFARTGRMWQPPILPPSIPSKNGGFAGVLDEKH